MGIKADATFTPGWLSVAQYKRGVHRNCERWLPAAADVEDLGAFNGFSQSDVGEMLDVEPRVRILERAIPGYEASRRGEIEYYLVNPGNQLVSRRVHGSMRTPPHLSTGPESEDVVRMVRSSDPAECRQQQDTGQPNPGHAEQSEDNRQRPVTAHDCTATAGRWL